MKLLVPLDGSPAANRALAHAIALLRGQPNGILLLLNVQNRDTIGLSEIDAATTQDRALAAQRSDALLDAAAQTCAAAGLTAESHAAFGPIAETIAATARELGADQIVMGTRGLGPVRGLLLGSVASAVIHLVDIPVTLVKQTAPARAP